MTDDADVVSGWTRYAGLVERYHTWPTLRRQNVAEHTWHVLRIYFELFGPPPPGVTTHILFHDCGEMGGGGDVEYGAKRRSPQLKRLTDKLQEEALRELLGEDKYEMAARPIGDRQKCQIKACDLLEMMEFAAEEKMAGSETAAPLWKRVRSALDELPLHPEDRARVKSHVSDVERRMWRLPWNT